jgi:spore germination cell wall hydrolase CwlJ-like protein
MGDIWMDINAADQQLTCMAAAMYHEAHTQSQTAQKAVGALILNRVRSGKFGRDACTVVFAKGQFLGIHDANHLEASKEDFLKTKLLAVKVWYKHDNPIGDRLYFYDDSIRLKRHKN